MTVVLISGHARSGKDTAAQIMEGSIRSSGHNVLVTHYADLVKYVCRQFFNWNGEKDSQGRSLLQYVGTDVVRKNNPDYWVDFILNILTLFNGQWDYVLIPDTRFPNEIEKIKQQFHTVHLRVERPNFNNNLTEEQKNHPSETALDDVIPDYILTNDGSLFDMTGKVNRFITEVLYEQGT